MQNTDGKQQKRCLNAHKATQCYTIQEKQQLLRVNNTQQKIPARKHEYSYTDENNANNSLTAGCSPLYSVRLIVSDLMRICKYTYTAYRTRTRISYSMLQICYAII